MKKAFIWDVDGTLFDTSPGITAAVADTLKVHSLQSLSNEELCLFIGPPIEVGFRRHFGDKGEDFIKDLASTFRKSYANDHILEADFYPGIEDVLKAMKDSGCLIGIATYKRQTYLDTLVDKFGLHHYASAIVGSDPEGKLTKADIIRKCAEKLGIDSYSDAYMIGDTVHDMNAAIELGMPFIGVTWGFGFKSADEIVGETRRTPEELKIFLTNR